MNVKMEIRKLKKDEHFLFKEIRLRALAESPDSFGQSFEAEKTKPDSYWIELLNSTIEPNPNIIFVAFENNQTIGLVFGLKHPNIETIARIGGMWIDPGYRNKGIGQKLLDSVVSWAERNKYIKVQMWVTESNLSAVNLYTKNGFYPNGKIRPLPSNPQKTTIELEKEL